MNNLAKLSGISYIFFKSMESVLDSNDKIYFDVYDPSLSKLVVAVNKMLFLNYLSRNMLSNLSRDELDVLLDNFVEDGLFRNVHDLKCLCDCLLEYDVNDNLSNIKAKTILITIEGQFLVNVEKEVLSLENAIDDVEVMVIQLDEGEFDNGESYSAVLKIFSFLNEYGVD